MARRLDKKCPPKTYEELQARVLELEEVLATLQNDTFTSEQVEEFVRDALINQIGFSDFAEITPSADVTLARVSNGQASLYNGIGFDIYKSYSPEAAFFLNTIAADTRVPEMQVRALRVALWFSVCGLNTFYQRYSRVKSSSSPKLPTSLPMLFLSCPPLPLSLPRAIFTTCLSSKLLR